MGTDVAGGARQHPVRADADGARPTLSPATVVTASLGAVAVLAVAGWLVWTQGALVGLRFVEFDSPLAMAALGFVAGIGGFFAPCAVALFPAYVSYYLSAAGDDASVRCSSTASGTRSPRPAARCR